MSRRSIQPLDIRLDDEKAERARRNLDDRVKQLAIRGALVPLGEVSLADGVTLQLAHRLGRVPTMVVLSPPRGAVTSGRIEEIRTGDRSKSLRLKATGWGATIQVDVAVL